MTAPRQSNPHFFFNLTLHRFIWTVVVYCDWTVVPNWGQQLHACHVTSPLFSAILIQLTYLRIN